MGDWESNGILEWQPQCWRNSRSLWSVYRYEFLRVGKMIDDMYSLLSWANDEELKAHNKMHIEDSDDVYNYHNGQKDAFRSIIDKIEKSPTELHRTLTLPRRF